MQQRNINFLLRLTTVLLFLGRAWHCWRWDPPFGGLYYDVNGFGKVLEWWHGVSMTEILRDHLAEPGLLFLMKGSGVVLLIAALAAVFINQKRNWLKWGIYAGVVVLGFIYYGMFKGKHYNFGMLFEHSAQFLTPLFLLASIRHKNPDRLYLWMKIAIAVTFVCHGLFAVGYYLIPGYFIDMMIVGFGMDEPMAINSLLIAGILDFVFAIAIFIPRIAKPALLYGVLWGFLTALARIYTTFDSQFMGNWFSQYFFQFLVRFSHFMLPLILWLQATNKLNRFPFRQR